MQRKLASAMIVASTLSMSAGGALAAGATTTSTSAASGSATSAPSHSPSKKSTHPHAGVVGGSIAAMWDLVDSKFVGCNRSTQRIARLEKVVKESQNQQNRVEANISTADALYLSSGKHPKHPKIYAHATHVRNKSLKSLEKLTAKAEREISHVEAKCQAAT